MAKNTNVLCVDDEPTILAYYQGVLSRRSGEREQAAMRIAERRRRRKDIPSSDAAGFGYKAGGDCQEFFDVNLHLAESGEEALAIAKELVANGESLAAGFFDMKLAVGGMDGVETIKAIRAVDPHVLCAVVTAYTDYSIESIRAIFTSQDEWVYFSKPFTEGELRQAALNLVAGWNVRREREEHLGVIMNQKEALRFAQEETIRCLAKAIEFRDDETGTHVQRMSQYCGLIASKLGLSRERCRDIVISSQLHDAGKIAAPDRILTKVGPLSSDERQVMERHTAIGNDLMSGSNSELLDLAAEIAHTHHERFDGRGYPRGLKGMEIPLVGRISAIADVFDALTSDRVYRKALSFEKTVEIMRGPMRGHFDPELLDLFLRNETEIRAINPNIDMRPTSKDDES